MWLLQSGSQDVGLVDRVLGSEPSPLGSGGVFVPLVRWLPFLEVALGRTAGTIQCWCRGKARKRPESGLTPLLLPAGPQARHFPVWTSVLIRKMEAHQVLLLPTPPGCCEEPRRWPS